MKRRILSLLLALCLIVSLLPMAVLAEDTSATDCTSGHTPGAKVELAEQRVNAAIALDEATETYSVQPGKYVYQCTCSVCGETYEEEEAFKPALLHYRLSSEDAETLATTFSGVWGTGNAAAPQLVINPGEVYYFVTNDTNSHAGYTYVRQLDADVPADKEIIDAGNWQMKFDYPVGRTPVLTMQGASIKNPFGLWYGAYSYTDLAPLTIVLKGNNVIDTKAASTSGDPAAALNLRTNSDVTITGDGTLAMQVLSKAPVLRISGGSIELNHANISIVKSNTYLGHAVQTSAGDIIINGGTFTVTGNRRDYDMHNCLHSARDIIIKNGAEVTLKGGPRGSSGPYFLRAARYITISESTVITAGTDDQSKNIYCGNGLGGIKLEYENGFTLSTSSNKASYNTSSKTYSNPSGITTVTEMNTTVMGNKYMSIVPNKALEPHTCGAANDDHDCTTPDKCDVCGAFLSSPDITAHTPEADDGNPATPVMCANPGCTQVVIPGDPNVHVCVVHTPGAKVELTEERVNAAIAKDEATETYSVQPGKYVFQYTCAVCGETWTEEEAFKPALLGFRLSSEDAEAVAFSGVWGTGNTTAPQLVINPGEVYYFVTNDTNSHADYTYVRQLDANDEADKAIIDAGTWNMKFEYPVGRTPVLTMQGATIKNPFGLWYGAYSYNDLAPLTIVLKGNNLIDTITTSSNSNAVAALNLRTNSDVTITGDGTLALRSLSRAAAAFRILGGSITMDHTNISIVKSNTSYPGYAIQTGTGDIVINGGTFTVKGNKYGNEMYNCLHSARDIIIKNGAEVALHGYLGTNSTKYYFLRAARDITISESTVTTIGMGANTKNIYCGNGLAGITLDYKNGFTLHTSSEIGGFNNTSGIYTPPASSKIETATEMTTTVMGNKYMSIVPNKALATFTDTAVTLEDDLDVSFRLKADTLTSTDGTVKFTVNGEETELALSQVGAVEGDYYVVTLPGLSAKEMTSEITATIYDTEGNALTETKSDSVQAYALRLLRDEENANDTVLKTLLVDMLIYGSMAQVLFCDYTPEEPLPYSALVTAVLTPAEMAYATQDNDMDATPEDPKASVEGNGYLGTTFELNSNIAMLIAVEGSATSAKVYVDGEYIEDVAATAYEGFVTFTFNGLAAADGRKDVKFEVYTGDTLTVTVTDSLANYVGRMRNDYPYMDELLKYCDAAAAYFTAV